MDFQEIGKLLIYFGLFLLVFGSIVYFLSNQSLEFLPGDLVIKKRRLKIYIPIVTCIIISLVLTLLFNLFKGR